MNIKEAKEQIKNAMTAYFTKDKFGNPVISIEKQRPIFLMGPPGIGKTAIMEQIAQELDVALVTYSMTHHTRQSALGLPYIVKKKYGDVEYSISEYTMSEIIASVYDMIEESGKKEGILFLDEVNCVSETLSPAMLQFLQYKTFGRHKIPNGWIVVTAGNPPEYNNSVREFDIVTWDRLKRIDVEPDYKIWKEYAYKYGIHPSIMSYLDIKKDDFYTVETTVDGKVFVTARGWSDLSDMICLYEQHGIKVDEKLVAQYLQKAKVAKEFSIYYDLYNKYKSDYQVDKILLGKEDKKIKERARKAKFDERLSLIGLLIDGVTGNIKELCLYEQVLLELTTALKMIKAQTEKTETEMSALIDYQIKNAKKLIRDGKKASSISADKEFCLNELILLLYDEKKIIKRKDSASDFSLIKADYNKKVEDLKKRVSEAQSMLENMFGFCDDVFPDGQELVILVTELTVNAYTARFISRHGCEEYFKHNKELLFYERQKNLILEIADLKIE